MGNQDSRRISVSEMRAAVLAETRAKIAERGWTVIAVFPTAQDQGPSFAYTVGLSGKGLPELAIYGLHGQVAHSLLNEVARRMVESGVPLQTGDQIEGVLVDDVALVAMEMTDARDLNLVRECYGAVAAAVQVVWPDADGVLPWEEGGRIGDAEQHRQSTLPQEGIDPQRDNNIRAGWAARALVAYAQHLGNASLTEEVQTAATDLLSDLRHLFDALGIDWEAAVSASDEHYRGDIFVQL